MRHKKAQIGQLETMVVALIAVGVTLTVSALILAEVNDQTASQESVNGYSQNATREVQTALSDIPGWLSIFVITVIGALLLGLVQMFRSR